MHPEVVPTAIGDGQAFQLERYKSIAAMVRRQVEGRIAGQRHSGPHDWNTLLETKFGSAVDEEELRARTEKTAALKELFQARISVLAGPAGVGNSLQPTRGSECRSVTPRADGKGTRSRARAG
jgi:hypothetical protein